MLQCLNEKKEKQRHRHRSKVRNVPGVPSPSTNRVQWRLIRNQGCGPTLPDSLSTMPLSFEKKKREREGKGGQKEGADSYVYADMYFKASISPTLRRFVMGRVYIALLSIHNGFSTTLFDTWGKEEQWITETLRGIDTNADIVFDVTTIIPWALWRKTFHAANINIPLNWEIS